VLPEGTNAVRIMTIHKAKGLEFEVVVMPFASEDLVPSFSRKVWFPVQNFFKTDFQHGLISFSSKLNYLGEEGKAFYEQALLADRGDSLNTLYVALTRAVSQMHIICTLERESAVADKSFATLFNQFVRQQKATPDIEKPFFWGREVPSQKEENKSDFDVIQPQLMIQPDWQKKLWIQMNTKHEEGALDAKQEGLLVHELLAKIQYAYEVQSVVEDAQVSGIIGKEERDHYLQMVTNIVEHPEISAYFDEEVEVFNERDILIPNDTFVRPDRIIKKKNSWVILDYKTGKQHPKHITQINHYREILEQMTQETPKCFLVYIGKKATVKQIA
jgi:ATP-dependent exoDNAse (exonuclease V) beta subunit